MVVTGITVTFTLIGMTTIILGITVLVTMVEGITTPMVSPWLGTIVRTTTPINIISATVKATTRVVIRETTQIDIMMRAMDGTKGHNVVEKVRIGDRNKLILPTSKKYPMVINSQHIVETTFNNGRTNYNSTSSLSALSSFVTHDDVTFDAKRNQGFLNAWTVK